MFNSRTDVGMRGIEGVMNTDDLFARVHARWNAQRIPAIRSGRLAFGLVLLIAAAGLTQTVVNEGLASTGSWFGSRDGVEPAVHTLLLWAWGGAFAAGAVMHLLVRFIPALDLRVRGTTSFVVPSLGAALLLPITVHLGWYVMNGMSMNRFNEWAVWAIALTALSHIGFAIMTARRARRLARGEEPNTVKNIFAWTVVLAALPFGIFLLAIPPVLVAITGIPIVPLLVLMERLAKPHRDVEMPAARVIA